MFALIQTPRWREILALFFNEGSFVNMLPLYADIVFKILQVS